jgi:hypothetical protein
MSELNINKDVLFLIFGELQDDSKSLFSCLMVNRLWCETVIPILWRDPWCYDIDYSNKNYLFIIITSYLSDDIKESLMRQGIQLLSVSFQLLLFDYLSFCRSINVNTINIITSIGTSLAHNQFILQQEFYSLFMKKFPKLKYLDIKSIKHQIFHYPEDNLRYESLCELRCDTSIDPSYFNRLAQLCQYIQRLIVFNLGPGVFNGIAKLINVQKNLKCFEWEDDHDVCLTGADHYKEILIALEKKVDTINHLKLFFQYKDYTSQIVLPKFHKLKTLITDFWSFKNEEQLKMCVYHDLKIFKIDYYSLKAASIIIENNGGHLKKFFFESIYELDDYIDYDNSLVFIRKVYENCPLIEYLSLIFPPSKQHSNEFEKLLKICQNLKSLLLVVYINDVETENLEELLENGEELLKILIRSAPTNLREIRISRDFKFSFEAFEKFLEKWRGRPVLTILTSNPIYTRVENYVKLINKYKNDGVIKDFRHESFMNVINMDFKI